MRLLSPTLEVYREFPTRYPPCFHGVRDERAKNMKELDSALSIPPCFQSSLLMPESVIANLHVPTS